jgi:hypothetical protein
VTVVALHTHYGEPARAPCQLKVSHGHLAAISRAGPRRAGAADDAANFAAGIAEASDDIEKLTNVCCI